jgi:hypothetical protein
VLVKYSKLENCSKLEYSMESGFVPGGERSVCQLICVYQSDDGIVAPYCKQGSALEVIFVW